MAGRSIEKNNGVEKEGGKGTRAANQGTKQPSKDAKSKKTLETVTEASNCPSAGEGMAAISRHMTAQEVPPSEKPKRKEKSHTKKQRETRDR